jgi:hypothetical protein
VIVFQEAFLEEIYIPARQSGETGTNYTINKAFDEIFLHSFAGIGVDLTASP